MKIVLPIDNKLRNIHTEKDIDLVLGYFQHDLHWDLQLQLIVAVNGFFKSPTWSNKFYFVLDRVRMSLSLCQIFISV